MQLYIFQRIEKASTNSHEKGGLCVIATDIDHVKKLVDESEGAIRLTEDEINKVVAYPLKGKHKAKVFVFPDAGCC